VADERHLHLQPEFGRPERHRGVVAPHQPAGVVAGLGHELVVRHLATVGVVGRPPGRLAREQFQRVHRQVQAGGDGLPGVAGGLQVGHPADHVVGELGGGHDDPPGSVRPIAVGEWRSK
jgi:hypothetical protein